MRGLSCHEAKPSKQLSLATLSFTKIFLNNIDDQPKIIQLIVSSKKLLGNYVISSQ